MNGEACQPPGLWTTVRLLLAASWKRAEGRRKRQGELLRARAGKNAINWGVFGIVLGAIFMIALSIPAAFLVQSAVQAGGRVEAERGGKVLVSEGFLKELKSYKQVDEYYRNPAESRLHFDYDLDRAASSEALHVSITYGGDQESIRRKFVNAYRAHGIAAFASEEAASAELSSPVRARSVPAMLGSIALIWWGVMLVFQGEGLELDLQRRRHPVWEWLFSHPVPPAAVFLAETLSPLAANPMYWGAPVFTGIVYGFVYGGGPGLAAALLAGPPIGIAAACAGKALETGIILRFSPRTRGAMIGIMSWLGYATMMLLVAVTASFSQHKVAMILGQLLAPLAALPWPWLGLFIGQIPNGSLSFPLGILSCWIASAAAIAGATWFCIWGAERGLSGNFGRADTVVPKHSAARFGKDPLYRKEILWFIRDRSAIVQTILIPLTVSGYQIFNMRGLLASAQSGWNYLCGVGILFGTYFLWILGPKSLLSEGSALWIALTWPRGLESLLKAKAWLWSIIASGLVGLILCYAAWLFPASIWKIALLGVGWFYFARSMAEKSVTLVTVQSASGEAEKIPAGRRWAASLGMLTFAIGVFTQHWPVAVMGIVYSHLTAAAMWQNFRARLPYLYDPWSEKLPAAPSLMHAMIAISIIVDVGTGMAGIGIVVFGVGAFPVVLAMSYCICAVTVSFLMAGFLLHRDVTAGQIWYWDKSGSELSPFKLWAKVPGVPALTSFALALAGGLTLGLFGKGYIAVLHHIPSAAELIDKSRALLEQPLWHVSYAVMAIGVAPFAEEYLFRGLLFRALDREWGGWRAILGSAAFFAIYHPPLAWVPVALLGATNCILFKKTGRLAPAVLLHMVYNAVVLS